MIIAAVILMLVAVFTVVINELAGRGVLPINAYVGLRIGSVHRSPKAWVAGHRAARLPLYLGAAVLFFGSATALFVPGTAGDPTSAAQTALLFGSTGVFLALVVLASARANTAANQVLGLSAANR
ncbi:MAG: hypothetical protein ACJAS7_001120 [Alpinimonas sp.]|jgi:hypothetical protein